jgi:hypothetical protein
MRLAFSFLTRDNAVLGAICVTQADLPRIKTTKSGERATISSMSYPLYFVRLVAHAQIVSNSKVFGENIRFFEDEDDDEDEYDSGRDAFC